MRRITLVLAALLTMIAAVSVTTAATASATIQPYPIVIIDRL